MPYTLEEWSEGLRIISENAGEEPSGEPLYAYNEKIEVYANPDEFTDDQLNRLKELGFHPKPNDSIPHFLVHV